MTTPAVSRFTVSDAMHRVYRNLRGRLIAPYQPDGVRWMLARELDGTGIPGGIVADEMGLGKTISALATCLGNELPDATLIIVPKSLVTQWARECEKFTGIVPLVLRASDACKIGRQDLEFHRMVVTSYHAVLPKRTGTNALLQKKWGRLILDEAHLIKSAKSKIAINCRMLQAGIKWCLTGTPITNRKKDFLALAAFVGIDSTNFETLRTTYVLRRTFEDLCGTCERLRLPACHIEEHVVELSTDERRMYTALCEEGKLYLSAYEALDATNAAGRREGMASLVEIITRLRQLTVHPQLVLTGRETGETWTGETSKLGALLERVRAHPAHSKTLIFTHWTMEMHAIKDMLSNEGLRVLCLNGQTRHDDRDAITSAFNSDPSVDVLIVQIECGGLGLNLQVATHVYINSLAWNATSELQAIARAHRLGVDHVVQVTRLVTRDSIDEYVLQKQQLKLHAASEVLGDARIRDKLQLSMTIRDMKSIFDGL